jgi:formylglycine-generating enzyme required for sulfatase activity
MGTWPSYFTNATYRDSRPVEQVRYHEIRENPANSPISPNWPASAQVHADSFMGRLRTKTGLVTLDLPTEAQWERACRAGTGTALNSGHDLTGIDIAPRISWVGRYYYDHPGGYSSDSGVSTAGGTAKVGSYLPNAWGLYDMHGNVWEWVQDWFAREYPTGSVTDPVGPATVSRRIVRGGSWVNAASGCRSAVRNDHNPAHGKATIGFRLVAEQAGNGNM